MPLRYEPDVSHANWFTNSPDHWIQLCARGPSGFARYARLFHRQFTDDDFDPETTPETTREIGNLPDNLLQQLTSILERHTQTPEDCFFGLWPGHGEVSGGHAVAVLDDKPQSKLPIPPAFPPEVMTGPLVEIPNREYLLFRGPLSEAGQWGAVDVIPGISRHINSPNLMWPADHAWFVATEVDLEWTGIGGSHRLIADLLTAQGLEVEEMTLSSFAALWSE